MPVQKSLQTWMQHIIVELKLEVAYYDSAVQDVNYYDMRTLTIYI